VSGSDPRIRAALRAWCRLSPARVGERAVLGDEEWRRLLRIARGNGVAGLLHRAAGADPAFETAPEDVLVGFRSAALAQSAASARAESDLSDVVRALQASGIEPVLMRGLELVSRIYRDGSLRAQIDHDILVGEEEHHAARKILIALGFCPASAAAGPYRRGAALVDLHSDPYGRERVASRGLVNCADVSGFRARCARTRVAGISLLVPSAEDRILLLAAHAAKHSFDKLIRLVDLAECWRAGGFDTSEIEKRARREGTTDVLYYALTAARQLVGAEIPESFTERLRAVRRPWTDRVFARVLQARASDHFAECLLLEQLPGARARLVAVIQMIWPREIRERARARGKLFLAIWYPRRALEIVARVSAGATASLLGRQAYPA